MCQSKPKPLDEVVPVVPAVRNTDHIVTTKIERLRGLIERGEYTVDLDELASRIVDVEFGRRRS